MGSGKRPSLFHIRLRLAPEHGTTIEAAWQRVAEPAEQLGSTDSWAHDALPLRKTHHALLSVGEAQEAAPSVMIRDDP
ncbi:hypothetical protein Pan181_36070 [Aeoliella mucimassa]|uniref:Uncharacterized protein n=1 Tax=Aeoliella mucimassa TaxID=2527972 RepID=A0A518ARP9_9BACT|nr:hypothetical protein Pan181_36070 [Aeoliella mucimassa]